MKLSFLHAWVLCLAASSAAAQAPASDVDGGAQAAAETDAGAVAPDEQPAPAAAPDAGHADAPPAAGAVDAGPAPTQKARTGAAVPGRTITEKRFGSPSNWSGELLQATDEEAREYQELVDQFGADARDFRQEISDLVQAQYREKRSRLRDEYESRISALEVEEGHRRLAAIERFERFLTKYPRDPLYSPDAIFRLAELHFEQSTEEYQQALRKYDQDVTAFDRGELKIEPVQPDHHYEKTISLYQRMITEFPSHRLIDGAYYLLGYCLEEQGEQDQAVVQFLELTRRFPQSRFFSEAWMRVGEYYFDNDKLPEAIAAYEQVLSAKDSPYYDKALYKLGWSHYRLNNYDEAIARFMMVLDFSNQRKAEGGANAEGSDLEPESLQYIAVSLSDDNWDRGIGYDPFSDEGGEAMVGFAEEYFKKIGGKPFETDVFVRIGDILFDASKYPGAVRSYQYALQLSPLNPEAPQWQDKVVQSWERARDFDNSAVARDKLVENFSEGTAWYKSNKDNIEALRTAANLARSSLYTSAIFHHTQAQKFQSQDKFDIAKVEYEQAAKGYGEYLKRFPHDKAAYELNWYLADALYNSVQFRDAANEYSKVRDSNAGTKYRADAAIGVYYALLKVVEAQELDHTLQPKKPIDAKERPEGGLPPPEDIPPIKQELITACDKFVERAPDDDRVPAVKATAAEIFYLYNHFDKARPRLEEVIDKYATTEDEKTKGIVKIATNYILEYLLTKKDWAEVEKFAQYVQRVNVGDKGEYVTIELGALFNKAKQFMDEGDALLKEGKTGDANKRLDEAAGEYVRLVEQKKDHEFADKALFNAALAYVKSNRFESALKLYERVYSEYPNSDLAPTALWEVADNAYKSYDFEKAIGSFFSLVKKYPKSPKRADAQYNAALTLENLQRYDNAAKEYENYARLFPERDDAPSVFYRAALVHEKRGDVAGMVSSLQRFLQKYGKDQKQTDFVIEAYTRIAEAHLGQKKLKDADKYYNLAVNEFTRRKPNTATPAGYHAAKAAFQLAEFELKKYEALKIGSGKSKEQIKGLERKSKQLKLMEKHYQEVLPYKQLEWSLASAYRLGYLYENLAESMLAAPCPSDVKRVGGQEACDEYMIFVQDKLVTPLEEKARAAYEIADKQAEEQKLRNEWTIKIKEKRARYDKSFKIDKEPKRLLVGDMNVGLDAKGVAAAQPEKSLKGK